MKLSLSIGAAFRSIIYLSLLLLAASHVASGQELRFAELGDFKLESGSIIRECRIGYRTFGNLAGDKSNVIVFTTWASGTTEQAKSIIGSGNLIDSDKYFVVAIDALGNGVSSSPSNSRQQPRMTFPRFTLRDTVNTQHELLVKVLHINYVKAVMGISMGGMQTFQWMVSFPNFMDQAIPIVGSPRLAPYDLVLWQAQIDAIMNDRGWNDGNYSINPARAAEFEFGALLLTSPGNYNKQMTRQKVFDELEKARRTPGFDANDKIRQAQAMMALNVYEPFGGSMARAAATVKAKVFVIVARFDHVVTPGPALEFAPLIKAKVLELESDCGHLATTCESQKIAAAVKEFLSQ
jgi:homoserine O-acetyltransferase